MKNKGMPKGSLKIKRIMRRYGKRDEGSANQQGRIPPQKPILPGAPEITDTSGGPGFEYIYTSSGTSENFNEKSSHSE